MKIISLELLLAVATPRYLCQSHVSALHIQFDLFLRKPGKARYFPLCRHVGDIALEVLLRHHPVLNLVEGLQVKLPLNLQLVLLQV